MYITNSMKKRIADTFYDKTVEVLDNNIITDAEGGITSKGLIVLRDTFLSGVMDCSAHPNFSLDIGKPPYFISVFSGSAVGALPRGDHSAKSLLMFLSVSRTSCSPPAWPTRPEARNAL